MLDEGTEIEVLDDSLHVYVEHTESSSYPGLRCAYELHRVDATVNKLPEGPFQIASMPSPTTLPLRRRSTSSSFDWVSCDPYEEEDEDADAPTPDASSPVGPEPSLDAQLG